MAKKRSLGYSPTVKEIKQGKLLSDLQRNIHDFNSPLLLVHNSYGGLLRVSIYS